MSSLTERLEEKKEQLKQEAKKVREERLLQQKLNVMESESYSELLQQQLNQEVLDSMRTQIEEVTGRPVWNERAYKDGKLIGLLRTIGFEFKHKQKLLEITGLPVAIVNEFLDAYGHPAFVDKNTATIVDERPMQINKVKELLKIIATYFDYIPALDDITQERVDNVYKYAKQRAEDTLNYTPEVMEYEE